MGAWDRRFENRIEKELAEQKPKGILELDGSTVNELGHHPVRLTDAAACTSCALCARVCPDAVFAIYARPRQV